jgi:hypothetical protein
MSAIHALFASLLECVELLPINVLRALSRRRVNTSLSGTLFF